MPDEPTDKTPDNWPHKMAIDADHPEGRLVPLTPIAERARDLVWNHKIHPKDAVHVATALDAKVEQFDTYDGPLIALSGKLGNPALVIGNPNIQESLLDL